MLPLAYDRSQDRDIIVRDRFDEFRREFLRTLVTPDVIEEHRRSPLGQHSERLERLLIYFRQRPLDQRYAVMAAEPFRKYQVVRLSGHRGAAPRVVDEVIHASAHDARHGLFLHCIRDLLET
jgi:branched-chain amino acid transport system permease protein